MNNEYDSYYTYEFDNYYAIVSPALIDGVKYGKNQNKVPEGFRFSSDSNSNWHTHDSFKTLLKQNGILN